MSVRTCPVPQCGGKLGETKRGDPWLMCRKHWSRVPIDLQYRMWRAYRSWQRLERTYLATLPGMRPAALLDARALAVSKYIEERDECVRKAREGEPDQLEMAQ